MRFLSFVLCFYLSFGLLAQPKLPLTASDAEAQTSWVDSLYNTLDLDQKIGQLFIPMVRPLGDKQHLESIATLVRDKHIGGVVFSTGNPVLQTQLLNRLQEQAKIPLLATLDGEWGVGMRMDSVMDFPWNLTLGAIQDNDLVYQIGKSIAQQHQRLGLHMNFSPVLDVNSNSKNPIIGNRSFGEDPVNVAKKGLAMMLGMKDVGLLTSGKHFPGHGDTAVDSHKTLPTVSANLQQMDSVEWLPYKKLIHNGLHSVMVGHLNVPALVKDKRPSSISPLIVDEILKKKLQFKGLIFTDAMDMKGVVDFVGKSNADLEAFLAGNDIILVSANTKAGINALKNAYRKGKISEDRLAHSVKKMLAAKYLVGLNKKPAPVPLKNITQELNSPKDSLLYAKAIGAAITVLENKSSLLPLNPKATYGYLSLGDASGGPFFEQLQRYATIRQLKGESINEIKAQTLELDALIIGFHRSDATPWKSEKFNAKERRWLQQLQKLDIPLVLNVFVKPYTIDQLASPTSFEGLVVGYQNNPTAQRLTADVLFGIQRANGKLPVRIGNHYPIGSGLDLTSLGRLGYAHPFEVGLDPKKLDRISELAQVAIDSAMTPGMQIVVARHGKVCYQKSFGYHTYEKNQPVRNTDIYDLASLTKILGTLPLILQAKDSGHIDLKTPLKELLPSWKENEKGRITIQEMLSHYGRLTPWIPFYKETLNEAQRPKRKLYRDKASKRFPIRVTDSLYLKKNYQEKIYESIAQSPLLDSLYYKYSDLPFLLFKRILENRYKKPLDVLMANRFYTPLGLVNTSYNAGLIYPKDQIVPSEVDTYFRYTELDGVVHDMGAALLGGVGGHAGLFSNAFEVAVLMQMYLQKGYYNGKQYFSPSTFDAFNKCYYCDQGNRRGVGLDKPFLEGGSENTCGCVSRDSFGHLGFTGTYAWADPASGIVFVFLSNRTYPSMKNNLLGTHNIRTRMQALVEAARLD